MKNDPILKKAQRSINKIRKIVNPYLDFKKIKVEELSEDQLLACSLWDDCDGEPANVYADEYLRRVCPEIYQHYI